MTTLVDLARISCPSIALIKYPPDQAFKMIAEAGYRNVDVLEKMPHFSIHPEQCDPAEVLAAAEKAGLRITNINSYVGGGVLGRSGAWRHHPGFEFPDKHLYTTAGFSSPSKEERERELEQFKRTVDIAAFFGARCIRFVAGDDDPSHLDDLVPWLKRAAEYCEKKGIYMGVENHDTGIMGQPELLVELFEKIGSKYVGVFYEPYNLMEQAGYDYRKAFEVMRDWIVHVHFKDGKLLRDRRNYKPVMMGIGEIDFLWILRRLDEIGYRGEIALEYEVAEVPPEQGIKVFYDNFVQMVSL